jgi:hypothetical protein
MECRTARVNGVKTKVELSQKPRLRAVKARWPWFLRAGILLCASLSACQPNPAPAPAQDEAPWTTYQDFERVSGWRSGPPNPAITVEHAHSGRYSTKVAPGIDYGAGYAQQLGLMTTQRPKLLKISAWIYLTDSAADAMLVVEVKRQGAPKSLLWQGIRLKDQVKKEAIWQKMQVQVPLPDSLQATDECLIYLWRGTATSAAYADDILVQLVPK